MLIGNREYDVRNKTYLLGILNITPDSFSDGGKHNSLDKALFRVEDMIEEGADIIDIGGESTRPGCAPVDKEEELARIIPVLEGIKSRFDIPISIDTYKALVAKTCIEAGADMINDIGGLQKDDKMAAVIANSNVPCVLMHNRDSDIYECFEKEFKDDIKRMLDIARAEGIKKEKIILDAGIGFPKNYEQNMFLMANPSILNDFSYPMLLGTSRKSFIGQALELPVDKRLEGTLTTTVLAVLAGYSFVRVHDIKENRRTIDMTDRIMGFRVSHA